MSAIGQYFNRSKTISFPARSKGTNFRLIGRVFRLMSKVEPLAITVADLERPAVGDRRGFAFTHEFWRQFVGRHWEKTPLLIKQPFATQLASARELFAALVQASEQYRAEGLKLRPPYDRSIKLRFCIEHSVLMTDIEKQSIGNSNGLFHRPRRLCPPAARPRPPRATGTIPCRACAAARGDC